MQVVADGKLPNYESEIKKLAAGASVIDRRARSRSRRPRGRRPRCTPTSVTVHGVADPETYPLQKKGHSFEFLRTIAHLRPRTNTFGAIARLRNCVSKSIHDFFQEQGFLYIHTPIITASDCEGAGEMFKVTTLDLDKLPRKDGKVRLRAGLLRQAGVPDGQRPAAGRDVRLRLGKVYTFGPTFRAENSNTPRHLAEFWMVEPEMAFYELDRQHGPGRGVHQAHHRRCAGAVRRGHEVLRGAHRRRCCHALEQVLKSEFLRVSYTEAVDILQKSGQKFEYPGRRGATTCRPSTNAI